MGSLIFDIFMLMFLRLFTRKQTVSKTDNSNVHHVFIPFDYQHKSEHTEQTSTVEHTDQFSDSFPDDWDF